MSEWRQVWSLAGIEEGRWDSRGGPEMPMKGLQAALSLKSLTDGRGQRS